MGRPTLVAIRVGKESGRWISHNSAANVFHNHAISMAMNHSRTPRLKPLLDTVPPGFLVDTSWLKARSIDPKSIHDYDG